MDVLCCYAVIPELSNTGTLMFSNVFFQVVQRRRQFRGSFLRVPLRDLLPECGQAQLAASASARTALSVDEARNRYEADDEPQKRWETREKHCASDLRRSGSLSWMGCAESE